MKEYGRRIGITSLITILPMVLGIILWASGFRGH